MKENIWSFVAIIQNRSFKKNLGTKNSTSAMNDVQSTTVVVQEIDFPTSMNLPSFSPLSSERDSAFCDVTGLRVPLTGWTKLHFNFIVSYRVAIHAKMPFYLSVQGPVLYTNVTFAQFYAPFDSVFLVLELGM